jgi:trimethylamine--corrinoid protein Co-methyltransferase
MMPETNPETGNRRRRRRDGAQRTLRQPDYCHLRHPFPAQAIFSEDEVAAIHDTALRVLEELGIRVLLPEARSLFAAAGARVEDDMVFIGREIVASALASAPKSWRLRAPNPIRDQDYAQGSMIFMAGVGCPNANDRERGRRPGSLRDFIETTQLCQSFDVMHMLGPTVEPQDVPIHLRHYATTRAQLEHADKPLFLYARGPGQVAQGFEMVQAALGLTDEEFQGDVWVTTVINSNSQARCPSSLRSVLPARWRRSPPPARLPSSIASRSQGSPWPRSPGRVRLSAMAASPRMSS